jgi:hypothetical protein
MFGELLQASSSFTLSFVLAREGEHSQCQGIWGIGTGLGQRVAPMFLTGALAIGQTWAWAQRADAAGDGDADAGDRPRGRPHRTDRRLWAGLCSVHNRDVDLRGSLLWFMVGQICRARPEPNLVDGLDRSVNRGARDGTAESGFSILLLHGPSPSE